MQEASPACSTSHVQSCLTSICTRCESACVLLYVQVNLRVELHTQSWLHGTGCHVPPMLSFSMIQHIFKNIWIGLLFSLVTKFDEFRNKVILAVCNANLTKLNYPSTADLHMDCILRINMASLLNYKNLNRQGIVSNI